MTTELLNVRVSDLDECAQALRAAVEGLCLYIASNSTLVMKFPSLKKVNEKIVEELKRQNRFLQTGLNKISALLTFASPSKNSVNLERYKAFRHGIALNCISKLSKNCRSQMEGSFKLVGDKENEQRCKQDEVHNLSQSQRNIHNLIDQTDE